MMIIVVSSHFPKHSHNFTRNFSFQSTKRRPNSRSVLIQQTKYKSSSFSYHINSPVCLSNLLKKRSLENQTFYHRSNPKQLLIKSRSQQHKNNNKEITKRSCQKKRFQLQNKKKSTAIYNDN